MFCGYHFLWHIYVVVNLHVLLIKINEVLAHIHVTISDTQIYMCDVD